MATVLCTGGTGFIGANLVRHYLAQGHKVDLITRPEAQMWRLADIVSGLIVHPVGLSNRDLLSDLVKRVKPNIVLHLAAYGAYSSQQDLSRMVETNIVGTINLVESCREHPFDIFINAGSSSEYGFKDHAPDEDDRLDPNSHYAWTKASATHYCRYVSLRYNLPVFTLRLYSIFGPYEEPIRLMPRLIVHGLAGDYPPLVNAEIARDFVYIADVLRAYDLLIAQASGCGKIYNLGTGKQTSLREVVETIRQILEIKHEPNWGTMPNRSWDTNVWVGNYGRLRTDTGWQPQFSVEDGLRDMCDWYRNSSHLYGYYEQAQADAK